MLSAAATLMIEIYTVFVFVAACQRLRTSGVKLCLALIEDVVPSGWLYGPETGAVWHS